MEGLEILMNRTEVKRFYQNVNKQRKGFVPISSACNDKSGNIITKADESGTKPLRCLLTF